MAEQFVKQHIVPKRYLDRFTFAGSKASLIPTRLNDKGKISLFATSTDNVGFKKNYYDVTDKADTKYWEHYFSEQIDTLCGVPLENLISTVMLSRNEIVLRSHEKNILAKLIIAQIMRVPDSLDYAKEIYAKNIDKVKGEALSMLPKNLQEKYREQIQNISFSEQWQKEQFLNYSFSPENFDRYCKLLEDRIWVVYVNALRKEMPFVTSDNPVLVEGIGNSRRGLFHNGLANPATCIFFPISPSIAVANYARNGIIGIAADKLDGRKFVIDDWKYITDKNIKIIGQSHRHSFIPKELFDKLKNNVSG